MVTRGLRLFDGHDSAEVAIDGYYFPLRGDPSVRSVFLCTHRQLLRWTPTLLLVVTLSVPMECFDCGPQIATSSVFFRPLEWQVPARPFKGSKGFGPPPGGEESPLMC